MLYGAAYYPEHWGEERLQTDIQWMKEAGFNVVRMGEFSWGIMQNDENMPLDLAWLDRAIERLGDAGIATILGTPTATPPKWLMDRYPEVYITDKKGLKKYYGSRRHYCVNSDNYIRITGKFVRELAEHYRDNQYIIGWQIDNELGGDFDTCYCDNCRSKFQKWLQNKYGNIEVLNQEWGTDVWSHVYRDFTEIEPVRETQSLPNPSCALDYKRFHSDSLIAFSNMQAEVLREVNPLWKITTNIFGIAAVTDNYKLNKSNDFVSWDFYPNMDLSNQIKPYEHAMGCDICRGYKEKPFVRMEMQSGTPGGDIMFVTPRPGDLARWTMQAIGRGAEGIVFFRWRTSSSGPEEYWHGIINHDGKKGRLYEEVKALGECLKKIKALPDTIEKRKVAILHNQEIHWAFELQPLIIGYQYYHHILAYYKALFDLGISCDFIHPEQEFDGYEVIIAPNFLFSTKQLSAKLEDAVKKGSTVIMDYRSGVKSPNNRMIEETLPTDYRNLLGIEVKEYGLIFQNEKVEIVGSVTGSCGQWFDLIERITAREISAFSADDYYDGYPAITENQCGCGKAYYIATELDEAAMKQFLEMVVKSDVPFELPDQIEAIQRGEIWILINHGKDTKEITLQGLYQNLLTEKTVDKCILQKRGYVLLKRLDDVSA